MFRRVTYIFQIRAKSTGGSQHISPTSVDQNRRQACRHIHNTNSLKQLLANGSVKRDVDFKIRKRDRVNSINVADLKDSNVLLDDLELNVNGERLVFNLTWLRDSCHCNQCTHQYSRQRLFTPKEFKVEKFHLSELYLSRRPDIEQPQVSLPTTNPHNDYHVNVKWLDGHESIYSMNWLLAVDKLYNSSQLRLDSCDSIQFKYPQDDFYSPTKENSASLKYWNVADIKSNLEPISYEDLVDGFEFNDDANFINANRIDKMSGNRFNSMLSLSNQLVTYGLAKIVGVAQERNQVLNVARSLAYERPTGYGVIFDVVVEPSEEINLAYSSLEFDLHSDLTYREKSPGVQMLHCIQNSTEGGLSYFSDSFRAAELLRQSNPKLFEVLLQFPVTFVVRDPYRNMKFRRQKPVISLGYEGQLKEAYYSPFMLPPVGFRDDVKLFYLAIDKFTQFLQSGDNKFISKMDPGDLFIFNNRRVLHGRSAYDATSTSRFLQGCYMDWDEIECLNEKLNSNKNSFEARK